MPDCDEMAVKPGRDLMTVEPGRDEMTVKPGRARACGYNRGSEGE
jgi:hypothetical protein